MSAGAGPGARGVDRSGGLGLKIVGMSSVCRALPLRIVAAKEQKLCGLGMDEARCCKPRISRPATCPCRVEAHSVGKWSRHHTGSTVFGSLEDIRRIQRNVYIHSHTPYGTADAHGIVAASTPNASRPSVNMRVSRVMGGGALCRREPRNRVDGAASNRGYAEASGGVILTTPDSGVAA